MEGNNDKGGVIQGGADEGMQLLYGLGDGPRGLWYVVLRDFWVAGFDSGEGGQALGYFHIQI